MSSFKLKKINPSSTGKFKEKETAKDQCEAETKKLLKKMYDLLYLMFAHDKHSLLIILHGIDTSGKDGTVRNIFAGANPQGIRTFSFKQPSVEELRHDFLWRCHKHIPECGSSAIFNRSYYEEVTTTMVHPDYLAKQNLPPEILKDKKFYEKRYHRINDFEKMLSERGTVVLKFLLHISKDEQKTRLEDRLKDSSRNWKFSLGDIQERKKWNEYMSVFEKMIQETSTKHSPWTVVPANNKWYRDYVITKSIVESLEKLEMRFPKVSNKKIRIT